MMSPITPPKPLELDRVANGTCGRLALVEHPRDRERNFGDVNVTLAIDADAVRRHQLIRILALAVIAELAEQVAVEAPDADARPHRLRAVPGIEEGRGTDTGPPRRA